MRELILAIVFVVSLVIFCHVFEVTDLARSLVYISDSVESIQYFGG